MNNINKYSKKGFALVATVLTMAILAILGVTILTAGLAETKISVHDKKRIQAYYLARAGVEATTSWLLSTNNPSQISGQSEKVYLDDSDQSKYFTVEIIGSIYDPEIIVKSTGTVDGVDVQAARLVRVGPKASDPVFKYTLYGETRIELTGSSKINGDVATPFVDGVTYKEKNLDPLNDKSPQVAYYPPAIIPTGEYRGNLDSEVDEISFSGVANRTLVYDKFEIINNKVLTINTGNIGEGNVNIVVNDFIVSKSNSTCLTIVGENRLNIFVKKSASLDGNINAIPVYKNKNIQEFLVDDPGKLIIFIDREASSVSWSSNQMFNCFFYAPGVSINVTGTPNFRGAIIGNIIELKGNFNVDGFKPEESDIDFDDIPVTLMSEGPWIKP